jgi:hypothetical protein
MIKDFVNIQDASGGVRFLVTFLIVFLINVLIIRFLWNTALVKHIKILAPVDTLLDTFLLAVALSMFSGSCICNSS